MVGTGTPASYKHINIKNNKTTFSIIIIKQWQKNYCANRIVKGEVHNSILSIQDDLNTVTVIYTIIITNNT